MKPHLLLLAALLFIACEKEEAVEPRALYDEVWELWTEPHGMDSLFVMVNSDTIEVRRDRHIYPQYLPHDLQDTANYFWIRPTPVRRGDLVRVVAYGVHDVRIGTIRAAQPNNETIEFVVFE